MTFIYFVIVLSITIMVHELGHFLFAKKAGVYIYEFSLGMGPKIFSKKKDETEYNIRLFPIGGFVSMAGEDMEDDTEIPKDKQLCNKSWFERFITMFAGILFNFILALIIFFLVAIIGGASNGENIIGKIEKKHMAYNTNLEVGDKIIKVDNTRVSYNEMLALEMTVHNGENIAFLVEHKNGKREIIEIKPTKKGDNYSYGFTLDKTKSYKVLDIIKYPFVQVKRLTWQMIKIVSYLVTGKIKINSLSGPIGIYSIVGTVKKSGLLSIIYLIAYLCINVAVINFLPFPAFDGGRILFLIIEKIKGSKINPKVENAIHSIGFLLLMILMIFVTCNDILKLF